MMIRYHHIVLVGITCLCAVNCDVINIFDLIPPSHGCKANTVKFSDTTTGEPIVGATVEWAPANDTDLAQQSADQHLDQHGEIIGITNEYGIIAYPICGWFIYADAAFNADYNKHLLRIHVGDQVHTVYPYEFPEFVNDAITARWVETISSWSSWERLVQELNEFP